jgi:hypothetical protein
MVLSVKYILLFCFYTCFSHLHIKNEQVRISKERTQGVRGALKRNVSDRGPIWDFNASIVVPENYWYMASLRGLSIRELETAVGDSIEC